jgi:hypothetical protein
MMSAQRIDSGRVNFWSTSPTQWDFLSDVSGDMKDGTKLLINVSNAFGFEGFLHVCHPGKYQPSGWKKRLREAIQTSFTWVSPHFAPDYVVLATCQALPLAASGPRSETS